MRTGGKYKEELTKKNSLTVYIAKQHIYNYNISWFISLHNLTVPDNVKSSDTISVFRIVTMFVTINI
jgi:hypothetical protein